MEESTQFYSVAMTPDHRLKSLFDAVSFVGELEHTRRHALRSVHVIGQQLKDSPEDEKLAMKNVHYNVIAEQCRDVRRKFMEKEFGFVDDEDWCLLKSTAVLRQLAYELMPETSLVLDDTEKLVDTVWGLALDEDMTGCKSCKEDRANGNA